MYKNIVYLVVILYNSLLLSQTAQEKIEISKASNKEANQLLMQRLLSEKAQNNQRIINYLKNNKLQVSYEKNNVAYQLDRITDEGFPLYLRTDNVGSSATNRTNKLYSGGGLGLNVQGQNMIAGVWDGSIPLTNHVGITGRNTNGDGTTFVSGLNGQHGTHVTGTVIASGTGNPNSKGIAFEGSTKNFNWTDDTIEMLNEAQTGMLVSNHSYGYSTTGLPIFYYGAYDSDAKDVDEICFNNPYYVAIKSAGNDRDAPTNPDKFGYDLITGFGNAKNTITVAAVESVPNYTDPSDVIMSSFSNYGPTDDGRIKPDISAKGVSVTSTLGTTTSAFASWNGTSMAAPGITGTILLLQQHFKNLNPTYMKAATAKGLLLHTADETGFFDGPDYEFGWGIPNAEKAAIAISNRNLPSNGSIIEENNLAQSATYTKTFTCNGATPLRVSISWTDPNYPAPNVGVTDPSTIYLVNDLDVKVTKNGVDYYPWKLQGMQNMTQPPTNNSTNDVDNFERVDIQNPSGTYTVSITHKGTLTNGSQNYTLIVTGPSLSLGVDDITNQQNSFTIYPNPVKNTLSLKLKDNLENTEITIYDMVGGQIIRQQFGDSNAININVSSLQKGAYIVRVKQGERISTEKFIKE